jgi:hypothetical protein
MNYYDKGRNKKQNTLKKEIIASATFIIGQKSSFLFYIASANTMMPHDHYGRTTVTNHSQGDEHSICLRHHQLG